MWATSDIYKIRKVRTGRRPEPPPEREEGEYRPLVWRMARVRTEDEEDEEREDVTLLTAGTNTVTDGGQVLEYRDSTLELVSINTPN